MDLRRRITVSALFVIAFVFMPVLSLMAGWPAVRATPWGAALSGFFGATERIGGSGGSIAANWGTFLFWFGMFLIGVPMVIGGFVKTFEESRAAMKRSMVAEGVVKKSELEVSDDSDATVFRPIITYHFTVAGKRYTNAGNLTNWWTNEKEKHEKVVNENPPGAKIPVYYDPDDCDNNSLMKWTLWNKIRLIIDVLLLSIGYSVLTALVGIALTLFAKSFVENPLNLQLASGAVFTAIMASFVLFSWYYFKKAV